MNFDDFDREEMAGDSLAAGNPAGEVPEGYSMFRVLPGEPVAEEMARIRALIGEAVDLLPPDERGDRLSDILMELQDSAELALCFAVEDERSRAARVESACAVAGAVLRGVALRN